MGELAKAWTRGLQSPRPSLVNASRELLQTVVTLKHFAVNSLENTAPWKRTTFNANATFGVGHYALADYYLRPFKAAIKDADARGVMCSYNSVMNIPTCLSPLLKNARAAWGFRGYVTSDTDAIASAVTGHNYVSTKQEATALGLTAGTETPFLRHLYIKCIVLPRQARDKHRENSKTEWRFLRPV
jgi:beta-glucosidase-like glycosyl hydrolase